MRVSKRRRRAAGIALMLLGLVMIAVGIDLRISTTATCGGRTMSATDRCTVTGFGRSETEHLQAPVATAIVLPPDPAVVADLKPGDMLPPPSTMTVGTPAAGKSPDQMNHRRRLNAIALLIGGVIAVGGGFWLTDWRHLAAGRFGTRRPVEENRADAAE